MTEGGSEAGQKGGREGRTERRGKEAGTEDSLSSRHAAYRLQHNVTIMFFSQFST